jgi:hypothetical protein
MRTLFPIPLRLRNTHGGNQILPLPPKTPQPSGEQPWKRRAAPATSELEIVMAGTAIAKGKAEEVFRSQAAKLSLSQVAAPTRRWPGGGRKMFSMECQLRDTRDRDTICEKYMTASGSNQSERDVRRSNCHIRETEGPVRLKALTRSHLLCVMCFVYLSTLTVTRRLTRHAARCPRGDCRWRPCGLTGLWMCEVSKMPDVRRR